MDGEQPHRTPLRAVDVTALVSWTAQSGPSQGSGSNLFVTACSDKSFQGIGTRSEERTRDGKPRPTLNQARKKKDRHTPSRGCSPRGPTLKRPNCSQTRADAIHPWSWNIRHGRPTTPDTIRPREYQRLAQARTGLPSLAVVAQLFNLSEARWATVGPSLARLWSVSLRRRPRGVRHDMIPGRPAPDWGR